MSWDTAPKTRSNTVYANWQIFCFMARRIIDALQKSVK
jgi:hypothetical protein